MVFGFLEKVHLPKKHSPGSGSNAYLEGNASKPSEITFRKASPKPWNEGGELDAHPGASPFFPPNESLKGDLSRGAHPLKTELDDLRKIKERKAQAVGDVLCTIMGVVVLSWLLGSLGVSCAWLLLSLAFSWALVKGNLKRVAEDIIRFESLRLHRRRALQADETCEWLNLLLNRWWVFSSSSIFNKMKSTLDPLLSEAKPAIVEAISLKELTLGDQTPRVKSVRTWDVMGVSGSGEVGVHSACSLHTPSGLDCAPTHALAILCDLILDSETFSAILAARVGHKGMGVDLDVGVEHLVVEGRVLVTLYFDMEAPFPHVARLTLSFTERPKVSFRVKILKSVQMMEVPLLKTWIHNLVMDALATAWVDPGHLEINVHTNEGFVPEQRPGEALAQGVLTVTLKVLKTPPNSIGISLGDEDKWVVISVGGTTHMTPPLRTPTWQDTCSFLLPLSPSASNMVVKVKSKKLITTTLTQYDLPLHQFNLEASRVNETLLYKKGAKVMGGHVPHLHARFEYTPLTPVNLDVPLSPSLEEIGTGSGVLYVMVHSADNLVSDETSPSPYCLVFNSRKKLKTTHFVPGSTSPKWECGVEVLVPDVSAVCFTFVICSLPKNPKFQDGDLMGIHTLNLSSVNLPFVRKKLPLNRSLSSPSTQERSISTHGSTITVSIVFRCVASVEPQPQQEAPHFRGMPLPVPGNISSPAGSPCLVSNSSPNIYPSVPSPLSSSGSNSLRRGSTGIVEDDNHYLKKKSNSHWFNQAKTLLTSHDADESKHQNLGDILATGLGLIELTIIRARDLVSRDLNGFSDPYCVVKVNGEFKYRTKVKKKTLDPFWGESFMTHLPKTDQTLDMALWDHDAFGKDFLGSISLTEENVRQLCSENGPVWHKLEDVKSGNLEIRIRLISEDHEFESGQKKNTKIIDSEFKRSFGGDSDGEMSSSSSSSSSSLDSDADKDILLLKGDLKRTFHSSETIDHTFKLSMPRQDKSKRYLRQKKKNLLNGDDPTAMHRASSNPALSKINGHDTSLSAPSPKASFPPGTDPLCTPTRKRRKSGAEIVASALAIAKANTSRSSSPKNGFHRPAPPIPKENGDFNCDAPDGDPSLKKSDYEIESIHSLDCFSPPELGGKFKDNTGPRDAVDLPKISLNDQSDDEYGFSDGSSAESKEPSKEPKQKMKTKKDHDHGIKAMKNKVRRSFVQPFRRFRSEANVREGRSSTLESLDESLEVMSKSIDGDLQRFQCGVGGGESDARELLKEKLKPRSVGGSIFHAISAPNLKCQAKLNRLGSPTPAASVPTQVKTTSNGVSASNDNIRALDADARDDAVCDAHSVLSSTGSLASTASSLPSLPSSLTDHNAKKTFRNVRGVFRKVRGLQLVKQGAQIFARIRISEVRNDGTMNTKTAGRSRLVPASSTPVFECEWMVENDLSNRAQIVLELRTSSRDLVSSANIALKDLFEGTGDEGCIEKWIDFQGGVEVLIKIEHGGDAPPRRRRSIFKSWSLHRIGLI